MSRRHRKQRTATQVATDASLVGGAPADQAPGAPSLELRGLELVRSLEGLADDDIVYNLGWSADGTALAATGQSGTVAVWSKDDQKPRLLTGHSELTTGLAWHPSRLTLATASNDGTIRLWNIETGAGQVFPQVDRKPRGVAWSPDGSRLATVAEGGYLDVFDVQNGTRINHVLAHKGTAFRPCWTPDGQLLVTCCTDGTINVQKSDDLQLLNKLQGHTSHVYDIDISPDGNLIASASYDQTARIWDLKTGAQKAVLEGHNDDLHRVRFSPDARFLASSSASQIRLWRCGDWECVATFARPRSSSVKKIAGLGFHPWQPLLATSDTDPSLVNLLQIDYALLRGVGISADSRRYVNAKVVLLGDTGVGKSGLALVLSGQPYQLTESTHGRNVWTFDAQEVEVPGAGTQTREVLLWDLAGQPGYRLVHQLHLGEVAVALIVFDSRSEIDPLSGVKHWVRALAQARQLEGDAAVPLRAYLVAGRADRGGVAVTKERVRAVLDDLGLDGFFETSAKEGWQVAELAQAVRDGIAWDSLPMVSSSALFDSIKQFLIEEKQQGRLLSTVEDMFRGYIRARPDTSGDERLRPSFETCIGRMESQGLIRRLHFGDLVLLQPELLDAYASSMVQAAKDEPDGLGFIPEEDALEGRFRLPDSERVHDRAQEKLLLIATVEELLRHEIALKEVTDRGMDLVFPSQFTKERPGAPEVPGREVTFTFEGTPQSVYATLAVRLSRSSLFKRKTMWQNAASYRATVGGECGIYLRELGEGRGELALFYDEQASRAVRSQFETYVAAHLRLRALPETVTRRAILACPACGYVLPDDLVRRRLQRNANSIRCPDCEVSVISLLDQSAPILADTAVAVMNRNADEGREQNVAAVRLRGKVETDDYDVFLCHNSKDKESVIAIGKQLKERGILPWLDIWEIPPGTRWQQELQKRIKSVKSAAVFIGPKGAGPWQELEVESLLSQLARRHRPIIPVILEGRQGRPRLPAFLDLWHVVDMRRPDPDPFEQLVWGITGQRAADL